MRKRIPLLRVVGLALLLIPYLGYAAFAITANRGPVDYETFMDIGHRFRTGGDPYGDNSYYPMPFAMVFALFDWLPRPASLALWLLLPVFGPPHLWLEPARSPLCSPVCPYHRWSNRALRHAGPLGVPQEHRTQ